MANNGFGTGVIFTLSGTSTTVASGSLVSFTLAKQAEIKEIVDGNDNFIYVGITKKKKVANATVLLLTSGSATSISETGTTATFTIPWSSDVTGNWGVTKATIKGAADDAVMGDFELQQWTTSTGQLP